MKKLIFSVLLLLMTVIGAVAQVTVTVCDGTATNSYIPFYGSYVDTHGCTCEFVIPAETEGMSDMEGGTISSLTFYISGSPESWGSPTIKVYMGEVDGTTLSSISGPDDFTLVYTGTVSNTNPLEIELDETYTYGGGNLFIGTYVETASSTYKSTSFYGVSAASGSSIYYSGSWGSGTPQSFLPKTTFAYTPGVAPTCAKPKSLTVSNISHNSVDISWTQSDGATNWVLEYSTNSDFSSAISNNVSGTPSLSISDLNPQTTYYVRVKADCGGDGESEWTNATSFSTTAVATEVGDSWSDNFEGATCDWELINGNLTNVWAWGEAVNNGGTHALYVSNDNGFTNEYSDENTMVYATKLLIFATGKYEFSYDWMANGESTWDFMRVALVPASVTLSAGTSLPTGLSSNAVPTGWIALDGGSKLNLVDTWQTAVNAVNVTAGNYYFVFAWRSDNTTNNQPPAAIDNVSITRMACAYDVTNLAVSNITTTGATLAWPAGEASQWQVAYSSSADFAGATEEIVNAATYSMTSLTSASTYYVKVRAYCGGTDFGAWSSVLEFKTACDVITSFPWSENFDGYTVASASTPSSRTLPTLCWNYINECSYSSYKYYPTIYYYSYTDYSHSTPNSLRLYSYYSSWTDYDPQPQYAILPAMENPNTKVIEFWAKGYSATSTFKIGLMTDPTDASTFVQIGEEQTLTTSYKPYSFGLTGSGNYIAIMIDAANSSRTNNGMYIDDITVREASHAAEILTYAIPGQVGETTMGDGTIEVTVPFTTDLNALAPVYTISDGAEIGDPVVTVAVNGESCTIEYNVTAEDRTTIKHWTVTVTKAQVSHDAFITAFSFAGQKAGSEATIVSNTENDIYTVKAVAEWNVDLTAIAPEVTISNAATVVPASGASQNFTSPVTYTVTAEDGTTEHAYIVTIINDPDACINPTGLQVNDVTVHTATLNWVQGYTETSYLVKVSTTAMADMNATADVFDGTVDATTKALEGLSANTQFFVYVQSVCNNAEGWISTNFTTPCEAITELPYTESFESETCPASCWNIEYAVANPASSNVMKHVTSTDNSPYGCGVAANDGDRSFLFSSYSNTSDYNQYLISPEFDVDGSYLVSFYYRQRSTDEHLYFGTSSTGNAISDFTWTTEEIPAYSATWTLYKTVVPAGTKYFAINYRPGSSLYYAWIDNVVVREVSTAAEILTYTLPTEAAPASITSGANTGTIDITVTNSTDFDVDLNPTYTISDYAEISAPVITGDGDSRTIRYTVTAEAGNSKVWTVNVTKVPVSRDAFITGFTFVGQKAGTTAEIVSNTESNIYTVHAVAEWNVDLTSIAPEITISPAAEITPESGYARDFTSPVTYTVTAEDGTTFHIYNVTIINDPDACVNPTAVNATELTATTATLGWTQAYTETSYLVKVSTTAMTDMTATADVFDGTVDATTKALEGLTANTQYFVYVQSNCDNAEDWTEYSFRTECGVFAVPFVETFENNSETVNCWTAISNNTENDVTSGKMGIFDMSGNNVFSFSSFSRASNEDYNQYLITPELALTEDAVLTFDYAKSSSSNENFRVMTSTTDANIASFTALGADVTATSTNFAEYRIVVPAATRYIAINYFSNYQYYLYVDNFKLTNVYTITASADPNGSIDPNGNVEVEYGESQSFTITPDECYHIASVTVDGVEAISNVDENGVYTFDNVNAAHTIAATFALNTYNIITSVVGNGTITESCVANCGENKSFAIQPQGNCYRIASFTVDGVDAIIDLDENGVYAMQNITADHELVATFEQITYTITATAGENGTITANDGNGNVANCGENKPFTIAASPCYRIASVLVDDEEAINDVVDGVYTFENVMANHTIVATFEQITYTITTTADANGSITANDGNGNVANCGENKMFTIEANDCYRIASVMVDDNVDVTDAVIAANGVYTFENVNAAHTIAATFAINTYAITTTVEGNGTITETSTVNCGANKEITITPASNCYRIASVIVDETENVTEAVIAANGVYTFENVIADHNIAATFEQITYTITATAGENGTITETSTVNCGDNKEITITPASCYRIASVLVDDVDVTATVIAANGVYTFENVTAAHSIAATFAINTYNITATAGEGGSITETSAVNCGANKEITITANEGYRIASVIVDETENVTEAVIAAEGVYTFENVTADHTIAATFERVHTISAGTGADGSITPEGIISVLDGESQTFTITPVNECFRIGQVMVDGVDVTDEVIANNGVYTFENVTENHNIVANFDAITLTITATASEGGTITHNSDYENIPCGSNETYTIVANEGYRIASVMVDGEFDVTNEVVANNGVYTFTNVRANHTIAATFELIPANTYTITATAGDGGTITPNGEVTVYEGDNKSFTIVANGGYRISSVMVDNETEVVAQLVDGVYTFTNVTANHTIAATFEAVPTYTLTIHYVKADNTPAADDYVGTFAEGEEYMVVSPVVDGYTADQLIVSGAMPAENVVVNVTYTINTYTITATAGANGTITPEEATVNYGASQAFTISANEGYRIVSVMVDETENVTEQLVDGVYTFVNVTANHTIAATFEAIPTYTITATANDGGSINPAEVTVVEGGNASFTIEAATGYHIVSVIVDATTENEVDVTTELVDGVYTFTNVTANHTINATFAINTYVITATAGENGTITPNDEVVVNYGATQTFSISANDGFRTLSVLVDGAEAIEQLVDGVYTFENVTADHTIAATFVSVDATTYTITATAGENGTITPSGAIEVVEGENKAFTIEAATGYHIASVMVDDVEAIEELVDGVYTFTNVTENHTIAATFAINTYTITATAGDNGTINPAEATVNYGASQEFTITPDEGYRIASVMVDETENVTELLVDGVYTFANVTANHTITATFEAIPVPVSYTITATAGEGGSINPAEVTVVEGGNASFTITANEGFRIASVIVDATTENEANVTEQLVEGVYTFANVTANHTIVATFEAIPGPVTYTITVNAGENGTVTYNDEEVTAPVVVNEGATPAFVITPAENYQIGVLTVDETEIELTTEQLAGHTYTFDAVEGDHTLAVTFVPVTSVEILEAGSMAIYPNPNNGMFSIDFSNIEGDATYQLINASGAVVETRDINVMNGETMNFSHDLRPGTYFVRIISGDKVYVEQIVVE